MVTHAASRIVTRRLVLVALIGFLSVQPASAQLIDSVLLRGVSSIFVDPSLSVVRAAHECVDEDMLRASAELILRRSGITVTGPGDPQAHVFEIAVTGVPPTRDGYGCAVAYTFELWRREPLRSRAATGIVVSFVRSGIVVRGSPYDMREELRQLTNRHTTTLANEILKARQPGS